MKIVAVKTYSSMNKKALDAGYEGLMIKPENDYYECKRSHAWLKMKPFIEVTLKVTEVHEGTGRHSWKTWLVYCRRHR